MSDHYWLTKPSLSVSNNTSHDLVEFGSISLFLWQPFTPQCGGAADDKRPKGAKWIGFLNS